MSKIETSTKMSSEFREQLRKIMPRYNWTVHKGGIGHITATGIQSSGFNRLSTLQVTRIETADGYVYEARSAPHGTRSDWAYATHGETLARALRALQTHYERMANTYRGLAGALQQGRKQVEGTP